MENLLEEIEQFCEQRGVKPCELQVVLNKAARAEEERSIKATVTSNKSLVGRCFKKFGRPQVMFPRMNVYYKVISERSTNQYQVSVLKFPEHPAYWFEYNSSKVMSMGGSFLGWFDFESVLTDEIYAREVESMQEITPQEYADALRRYTEELIALPWYAEHYRLGEKWPTDPDFPRQGGDE